MNTQLMGIGATVSSLRKEFPDISVSKVRFLESEGLVTPLRTPSGYRKFTPQDVERIRYILTMQKEHYLPLRVIAEHLDALDRGLAPPEPTDAAPRADLPTQHAADLLSLSSLDTGVRLLPRELCGESGLTRSDLAQAVEQGLLPESQDYSLDDLQIARSLAALRDCGVPVRNARPVVLAVHRERDLYRTALGTQHRGESAQEYAERGRTLASALLGVHIAYMRSAL